MDMLEAVKAISTAINPSLEVLLRTFGEPHTLSVFEKYEVIDDAATLEEGNRLCTAMNSFLNFVQLLEVLLKDLRGQSTPELVKYLATEGEPLLILLIQLHRHLTWELQMYKELSPRLSELHLFDSSPSPLPHGEQTQKPKTYPLEDLVSLRSKNAPVFFFFLATLPNSIKGVLASKFLLRLLNLLPQTHTHTHPSSLESHGKVVPGSRSPARIPTSATFRKADTHVQTLHRHLRLPYSLALAA